MGLEMGWSCMGGGRVSREVRWLEARMERRERSEEVRRDMMGGQSRRGRRCRMVFCWVDSGRDYGLRFEVAKTMRMKIYNYINTICNVYLTPEHRAYIRPSI